MTLEVRSAYTEEVLKTLKKSTLDEANAMLETAYTTFKNKKAWLQNHERVAILEKLALLVAKEADEFAMTIAQEGGKPLFDAKIEVSRAIDGIKLAGKELMHTLKGDTIPMGFNKASEDNVAFTIHEPIGVVLSISAFNHPLNLIVHQVIPAVAVGCPVIVKPAGSTPSCCVRLVELLHEAGLPKQWCQSLVCDSKVADAIVSDKRISFFSFIGSAQIGWYLRNKLANGVRYALEHGGVAPVLVDKTLDNMESVVASIVKGGFYHAGQVCISSQRIFIHEDIFEEMAEKLTVATKNLKAGDPTLIETEVGPLISSKEVDRVDSWVNEAVKDGAKLLCGGSKISNTVYAPTILSKPPLTSKVSCEEVFGPVICLYSYKDINEAIDIANSVDMPFQAAVFSNNINNIMNYFHNIDSSAVIVNNHSAFRVDWMPFAGRRSTAYGVSGIGYAMEELVCHKMAVIKWEK